MSSVAAKASQLTAEDSGFLALRGVGLTAWVFGEVGAGM